MHQAGLWRHIFLEEAAGENIRQVDLVQKGSISLYVQKVDTVLYNSAAYEVFNIAVTCITNNTTTTSVYV